jgi:hypothetical protein
MLNAGKKKRAGGSAVREMAKNGETGGQTSM